MLGTFYRVSSWCSQPICRCCCWGHSTVSSWCSPPICRCWCWGHSTVSSWCNPLICWCCCGGLRRYPRAVAHRLDHIITYKYIRRVGWYVILIPIIREVTSFKVLINFHPHIYKFKRSYHICRVEWVIDCLIKFITCWHKFDTSLWLWCSTCSTNSTLWNNFNSGYTVKTLHFRKLMALALQKDNHSGACMSKLFIIDGCLK